jgi:hypothetical protein
VVVVVFAVRGDSYAGFGEVRGWEVVHCVGCLCMCGWVVGCAEVLRSSVGRGVWVRGTLSEGVAEEKEWETGGVEGLWRTRG